jgi:cysteine synthase A
MKIANRVTELVGNTPLLRLSRIAKGCAAEVLVKLEYLNPLSSMKDRVALAMIEDAERRGLLSDTPVVIEPTSGNTGISLASVCAVRGYRLILTMPDTTRAERRELLAFFGAEIVLTPGSSGMRGAIEAAEEIAERTPGAFMPRQFNNPANPEIHRKTTAEEILRDTRGKVDILVAGVGSGGSFTGISEVLKQRISGFQSVAVEPADSPLLSGGKPTPHKISGLGAGFVPQNLRRDLIDEIVTVSGEDAGGTVKRLAREEGILLGISSGASIWAALKVAERPANRGKTVVAIAPDGGERYLGTWLFEGVSRG